MRSKTSFFNGTLCLSAVRRFWPLWAGYFAILFLSLPLLLYRMVGSPGFNYASFFQQVCGIARVEGVVLGAVVSVFAAMAVWSFLYNARSASGWGCLPVRREGQFFSALLAGFLPLAAANLLAVLLSLPVCLMGHFSPLPLLYFFCVVTLMEVFFYGFATLCAFFTGHILILPAVYALLNFTAVAVEFLLRTVLGRFVYGLDSGRALGMLSCYPLSPPVGMLMGTEVYVDYVPTAAAAGEGRVYVPNGVVFQGWDCLLLYALAGLVCMALALALSRRRKLESAGDVVAVGFLRPVFRWCMALGCGLVLACLMEFIIFNIGEYDPSGFRVLLIFFLLGAFVGWFGAEMLMKKSFRVFGKRAWGGFGLCCAVILILMLGMRFDLFGYEKRVPKTENVRFAEISSNGTRATLKERESLEQLTALHKAIVADRDLNHRSVWDGRYGSHIATLSCRIIYTLQSGRIVERFYNLAFDSTDPERIGEAAVFQDLLNTREGILSRNTAEIPLEQEHVEYAEITAAMTLPECAAARNCADAEEYLLCWYVGYDLQKVRSLTQKDRRELAQEVLDNTGTYAWENFIGWKGGEYTGPQDLVNVYVETSFGLDAWEAEELYRTALLPDLEAGNIGEVWLLPTKNQMTEQYSATVELAWSRDSDLTTTYTRRLSLSPNVRSSLTNAWLEQHGVVLHTVGEIYEASGVYVGQGTPW